MDPFNTSVWAGLAIQLGVPEHDTHPTAEDSLAVCAGEALAMDTVSHTWLCTALQPFVFFDPGGMLVERSISAVVPFAGVHWGQPGRRHRYLQQRADQILPQDSNDLHCQADHLI